MRTDGEEEVRAPISGLYRGLPDIHAEPGKLRRLEDAVFVECITTGTHNGFFAGIEPTGKKIQSRSACIFEFDGDKLLCERVYLDMATILRQLGALPPLPQMPGPPGAPGGPGTYWSLSSAAAFPQRMPARSSSETSSRSISIRETAAGISTGGYSVPNNSRSGPNTSSAHRSAGSLNIKVST